MSEQSLTAIRPKRFVPQTTDLRHNFGFSPHLLREAASKPIVKGQVIVATLPICHCKTGGSVIWRPH